MHRVIGNKIGVQPAYEDEYFNDKQLLIKPDIAKKRVNQGIIKYIGGHVENKDLQVGDYVLFSGYDGTLVVEDNEKTIVLAEEHIIAVLNIDNIEVPGLYFKDHGDFYFPATAREALALIARAFAETKLGRETELANRGLGAKL